MIDLDLLQKGADYDSLNHSLVIFICTFDPFDEDRSIYRFRNVCQQIPALELKDGTEKVFVNTKGHLGDVDEEFRQIMDVFNGLAADGDFAEELQQEVDRVKASEEWRHEYMTLQVLLDDTRKEAHEAGRAEGDWRRLTQQVCKKLQKGKSVSEMADELEESEETIRRIVTIAKQYDSDYDMDAICKELLSMKEETGSEENS